MSIAVARRSGALLFAPVLVLIVVSMLPAVLSAEIRPLRAAPDGTLVYAERTLGLGVEIDRDAARLILSTSKARPFTRPPVDATPPATREPGAVLVELTLLGPDGARYPQRLEVSGLCLEHDPGAPPHVEGDTIRLHRDSFAVELPQLAGFDRVEIAWYGDGAGRPVRRTLGVHGLDSAPALGSPASLSLGAPDKPVDFTRRPDAIGELPQPLGGGEVHWPEEYGDSDVYRVYGDEAEIGRRINVVLVPDGYTYASKATMEAHADALVNYFRASTPFQQHDLFVNYILVYAYSNENGTDQCDCDIILNTAMGTRFAESNPTCGSSANRCLYYGTACDQESTANIVEAELRAPAHNKTIIMVNTTRYGGCGGSRAVYAAGNGQATAIAIHEIGHSLGGLADEYVSNSGCGGGAGEINTSTNASAGAWPEWIGELGAPRQGAQYYPQCIYRPLDTCMMRSLGPPFCPVCNQRWGLVFFGHPNVAPSAPIDVATPDPGIPISAVPGQRLDLGITTRFPTGTGVGDSVTWAATGPGPWFTPPTSSEEDFSVIFRCDGSHQVEVEAIGDVGMIKPERYGANVDTRTWNVDVDGCCLDQPLSPVIVHGPSGTGTTRIAACPQGKRVVSGGCTGVANGALLRSSLPYGDKGWECSFTGNVPGEAAWALCVDTPTDACWGIGAVSSATSTSNAVWVTCPAGEKVLGGGCKDSTNTTLLRTTRPHGVDGWACEFAAASGGLSAHAICAAGDLDIGLQVAVKTSTTTPTPAVTVKCPSPKKVVGGGCADNFSGTSLVTIEPYLDAGWTCAFRTNPGSISAYAVCEDP